MSLSLMGLRLVVRGIYMLLLANEGTCQLLTGTVVSLKFGIVIWGSLVDLGIVSLRLMALGLVVRCE